MLIIKRWLRYLDRLGGFRVFLLEILAIFIGITASLMVDDWRQRRDEVDTLEHLLEEIHANALVEQGILRMFFVGNSMEIASTLRFLYPSSDKDNSLQTLRSIVIPPSHVDLRAGYDRLSATQFSIPLEETVIRLDEVFAQREIMVNDLSRDIFEARRVVGAFLEENNLLLGASGSSFRAQTAVDLINATNDLLSSDLERIISENLSAFERATESNPRFRGMIRHLLDLRYSINLRYVSLISWDEQIAGIVRNRIPNVSLPLQRLEIVGSATGDDTWQKGIPLRERSNDPGTWSLDITLVDGELKFRTGADWALNWGASLDFQNFSESRTDLFDFNGNPEAVFPNGRAFLNGANIPVKAGRYRVIFDSRTFDYRFTTVSEEDS
jgi:hypothetical protein